ncbi:hypothetical protein EXE44_04725 [Halorubrum sp. SS7]|uniref:hypothetical protein n=1 Tax=Halorubrum sp. SS7 TaxID=2518119 RepID=UPI0010F9E9A3|nr:hypothetical protein [Halorubrum sp. SS7]TKX58850.1 hypothetical protein EXE44_04725 [Halorubrum sp. SS7]
MSTKTVDDTTKLTDSDAIEQALNDVEAGDALTIEAENVDGSEAAVDNGGSAERATASDGERYKDHRVVQFVEYNGHFQFGEPTSDGGGQSSAVNAGSTQRASAVGRVVKPEYQMIYELGDTPTEALKNGMEITAVWVFNDE